jgi:phage shock protein PspC (stress-responsive transcriptional regulator)
MICVNCQKQITDGSNFCYNCGARQPATGTPTVNAAECGPRKRLVRSTNNKKIAGVAAGLADYFDLDPTIIRVVWLLAFFCGGAGLLAYIILWIALPPGPTGVTTTTSVQSTSVTS